jgi:inosose dehydratase
LAKITTDLDRALRRRAAAFNRAFRGEFGASPALIEITSSAAKRTASMTSRRDFIQSLGAITGALLPWRSMRLASTAEAIRFGYAAITWGGDDERAIDDISALGFPGIQLRTSVLNKFDARPEALRELLAQYRLTFVALSSGNITIDPAAASRVIDEHVNHAKFLRDAGGLYLQLIDERPAGRTVIADDYRRLGRLMSEIGKRATDLGVSVGYHPHMGSMGEKPAEIDRILDASDAKYVKLLLDVAHYQVGGGDPVAAIRRYADRLLFLHIKDVRRPIRETPPSYEFVELGRGSVDLPGVFAALRHVHFTGWAIVELDSVPDKAETPKEAAAMSKRYLEQTLGQRVS